MTKLMVRLFKKPLTKLMVRLFKFFMKAEEQATLAGRRDLVLNAREGKKNVATLYHMINENKT